MFFVPAPCISLLYNIMMLTHIVFTGVSSLLHCYTLHLWYLHPRAWPLMTCLQASSKLEAYSCSQFLCLPESALFYTVSPHSTGSRQAVTRHLHCSHCCPQDNPALKHLPMPYMGAGAACFHLVLGKASALCSSGVGHVDCFMHHKETTVAVAVRTVSQSVR